MVRVEVTVSAGAARTVHTAVHIAKRTTVGRNILIMVGPEREIVDRLEQRARVARSKGAFGN